MKSKILFIFFLSLSVICQDISYEALKRQGAEYVNPSSVNDLDLELEIESKNHMPVAPSFIGKFWCDPSIKLNSVRQDVMTNMNYNKYLIFNQGYYIDISISFFMLLQHGVIIAANTRRNYSQ